MGLLALVLLESQGETPARTRQVYATYRDVCTELGTNDISLDRVRDHLKELDLLSVTQYSTRTAGSEGGRKYFWELNTDFEATIEMLDSIDRLDGVFGLVDWFTTHPGVGGVYLLNKHNITALRL
ncbi:Cdc6/Cdc18 family protein [Halonotius pteroides]|uniref:Cdc6 C-terminal domain-containing protein n=1 Tax=Halonotius pteroides TaxID=268735 RepID=A0A3A6QP50_9EURY|nr:hypothetical protein DP106_05215 [Halonotius pteroides]